MHKDTKKEKGQTGRAGSLPVPTEADGVLSLRHFFFAGNTPLLELVISLPLPTGEGKGAKRIADFYRELAKNAITHAAEALVPALQREYEADTDPRKRFRHRPARLVVRGRVSEESADYFSVVRESRLMGAQGEKARREADIFSAKSGRLHPPAYLRYKGVPLAPQATEKTAEAQAARKRKNRPRKAAGQTARNAYFLENGALWPLTDKFRIF